ncbi:hypothetical protein [Labrys wisconsinensis]|uniref:Transcriptional regulator n=1 Tax=Labrys wisconsinensis TaxID=425677 RepID=A0ABU0JEU0_9HYPH|nr:hypothetical protein [Labrys wisconsinensis]MDQ0472793.1 hypothetical protein [Labrys wisconsinensis]
MIVVSRPAIALPDRPFGEIALDLHMTAFTEGASVTALEVFIASLPSPEPVHVRTLVDVRRRAALVGRLSTLFRQLEPVEPQCRAILAALEARP